MDYQDHSSSFFPCLDPYSLNEVFRSLTRKSDFFCPPFQMIIYAFMGLFVIPHAQGVDLFEDLIQFKEDVINGNYVSK